MGDKITPEERAAILAYAGKVTRCPDGEAQHATLSWHISPYDVWLSQQGIAVVPDKTFQEKRGGRIGREFRYSNSQIVGSRGDLVDQLSAVLKAA
jgi:hypothetical protein